MTIELINETSEHSFFKMTVQDRPGLERVMTNSSDALIIPKAVDFARDAYEGAPVELQSPQDAWIARLAQDPKKPTDRAAFDFQLTRACALVWFENGKPFITIYTGIPHNLALTRAQEGYDSLQNIHDWQVPLAECRDMLNLQQDRIRPHPGVRVELSTKTNAERDQLTQDLFGEATPLVAKYLSDKKQKTLTEYFPSTYGIKPNHARVRAAGLGGFIYFDYLNNVSAHRVLGRARGVAVPAQN